MTAAVDEGKDGESDRTSCSSAPRCRTWLYDSSRTWRGCGRGVIVVMVAVVELAEEEEEGEEEEEEERRTSMRKAHVSKSPERQCVSRIRGASPDGSEKDDDKDADDDAGQSCSTVIAAGGLGGECA